MVKLIGRRITMWAWWCEIIPLWYIDENGNERNDLECN